MLSPFDVRSRSVSRVVVLLVPLLLAPPVFAQTPDAEYCEEPGTLILGMGLIDGATTNPRHEFTVDVKEDFVLGDAQVEIVWSNLKEGLAQFSAIISLTSPAGTTIKFQHGSHDGEPGVNPDENGTRDLDCVFSDYGRLWMSAIKDRHMLVQPRIFNGAGYFWDLEGEPVNGEWLLEAHGSWGTIASFDRFCLKTVRTRELGSSCRMHPHSCRSPALSARLFHWCSMLTLIPRSRATCLAARSFLSTKRTASSLNSLLYFFRGFPMMDILPEEHYLL